MKVPDLKYITRDEFEQAEGIYKLISDDINNTYVCFELGEEKYYVAYGSNNFIKVEFLYIENQKYLLIGVDLYVVALNTLSGRIVFSLGLFSFFKGFKELNETQFIILTELEDIFINKHRFSIGQIISHDLEF